MNGARWLAIGALALPLAGGAALGQVTWNEVGDAGDLPASAQVPTGVGSLDFIAGSIASSTDADMYLILINDPALFGARTVGTPGTLGDTQLWLFDAAGNGVVFNDDTTTPSSFRSAIGPAYTGNSPTSSPPPVYPGPGVYFLAITGYNVDATSATGLIWNNSPFLTQRPPDGLGAPGPITGWTGTSGTGTYTIELTGAKFIPAPGSLALLGLGALAAIRRRR